MRRIIIPGSLLLFGLVFVVISIFAITSAKKDFNTTKGVITNIEEKNNASTEENEHYVYITYSIDDTEYENVSYPSYHSRMDVGDEVIVLYDPNDPMNVESPDSETIPIAILVAGIIAIVVSSVMFFSKMI